MSFSLWALACRVIPKRKSLAHVSVRQARMHPQSKGGSVLRLRSRRALSPAPPRQHETTLLACHLKTRLMNAN
jgi:hypothetical protein